MTITPVSERADPIIELAEKFSKETSIYESELCSRALFATHGALVTAARLLDYKNFIVSTISTIRSGNDSNLLSATKEFGSSVNLIAANIFYSVLKTANPRAQMEGNPRDSLPTIVGIAATLFTQMANYCQTSENFFVKEIGSRAIVVFDFVVGMIAAVVDSILGVIASIFALLALGSSQKLNEFAVQELIGVGLLLTYPFSSAIELINPVTASL